MTAAAVESGPMRQVRGFELDRVEAKADAAATRATAADEIVTGIRLRLEALDTTVRLWGKLILVAAPMLGAAGAWIVLRVAAAGVAPVPPPQSATATATPAAAVASTATPPPR